jgi:hypothetical protein
MTADEKKKAAAVAAAIAIAAAIWLCLQRRDQQPDKALIFGQVTDIESLPINGIQVLCDGYSASTDVNGLYQILNIEPGTYDVTFTDPYGRYQEVTV